MGLRRLSIAAAIAALGALVFAPGAQACSCARTAPAQALRQADAAISGRLVGVIPRGRTEAIYRYRVRRVFKRAAGIRRGRTISVRSPRFASACGLPKRTGRRYGLLLTRTRGGWASSACGLLRKRPCSSHS